VRGDKEKGNINTPLELAMNNQIDRFNLVIDVIDRVPGLGSRAAHVKERMKEAILANRSYAHEHGMDAPGPHPTRQLGPEPSRLMKDHTPPPSLQPARPRGCYADPDPQRPQRR
jgi:hypothetical protein